MSSPRRDPPSLGRDRSRMQAGLRRLARALREVGYMRRSRQAQRAASEASGVGRAGFAGPGPKGWLERELAARGVGRREFLKICGAIASCFALPRSAAAQIAEAVAQAKKPVVVWLEFQDCAGNTESFLRGTKPTAAEAVLDVLSVDYHETIMAAA